MKGPVLLLLSPFLLLAASAPVGPAPSAAAVQLPDGFNKVLFEDDFSTKAQGASLSSAKWAIDTGTGYPGGPDQWGTSEVQTYTSSAKNLAVTEHGTLRITPIREESGEWTSGRVENTPANDFSCPPGGRLRMQASIKLGPAPASSQMGIWPAFWSLGSAFRGDYDNWPEVGEIDILEGLHGAPTAWQTVHCGPAVGGPCHESQGIAATTPLSRGEWHEVAVEIDRSNPDGDWSGEKITWFVDGAPTNSVAGSVVGDPNAWEGLARGPRFLILNVACGGGFADAIAKTKTPTAETEGGEGASMEVRYVAVFGT